MNYAVLFALACVVSLTPGPWFADPEPAQQVVMWC